MSNFIKKKFLQIIIVFCTFSSFHQFYIADTKAQSIKSVKNAWCSQSQIDEIIILARNDIEFWNILLWRERLHEEFAQLKKDIRKLTKNAKIADTPPSFSLLKKYKKTNRQNEEFNANLTNNLVEPIHRDFLKMAREVCPANDWFIVSVIRSAARDFLGLTSLIPFHESKNNE